MYKIAVVGDYDSIYGFAALGLSVFPADDRETLCAVLRRLAESGYGVIYITESKAALVQDVIEEIPGAQAAGGHSDPRSLGKHRSGDRPGEEIRGAGSRLRYYIYRLKRTGGDG